MPSLVLGLTGVLRVWIHAAGICDSGHSNGLCDNCGNLFPTERRELSLAMDFVFLSCFNGCLRLLILHLLLLRKDQDVRILPDKLLLWIHHDVLSWPRHPLR